MIKLRELIAYQVAQEPERHRELVKQLERSRATRSRRWRSYEGENKTLSTGTNTTQRSKAKT